MVKSEAHGMAKGGLSREESRKFVNLHPASQMSLPRNVDKTMFGHGAEAVMDSKTRGEVHSHMALSEQFLACAGQDRSSLVISWMDRLKNESQQFIQERRDDLVEDEMKANMYRSSISHLVDGIFHDLRWCAHEYNKVAKGTPLQVSSSILGEVNEVVRVNSRREVEETATYFRARLSNRKYSLVVRGGANRIDFYIVPVSQVMAMSIVEAGYAPIATVAIKLAEAGVVWRTTGCNYRPGSLEELSMWIFSQFVEATRRDLE